MGPASPSTATVFEALIDSIIEQQISLKAAWSMQRRLIEAFGDTLSLQGRTYFAFPVPEKLAAASIEQLRACGLSGRKAEYVQGVAELVADGLDLESFRSWGEAGDHRRAEPDKGRGHLDCGDDHDPGNAEV